MKELQVTLRTLTPLWTGGVDKKCDRLYETGLIGSLRWWYEALVRGLDSYACDPTGDDRCPNRDGKRCAACEVFGCTGWARKFRLRVLDKQSNIIQDCLAKNTEFTLQFLELREMSREEKWLLVKAMEIAARYGALGGKTTLKPQKKSRLGKDYGIVELVTLPNIEQADVKTYLRARDWRHVSTKLPDMRWFFFIQGAFLWRKQMNQLMGLSDGGKQVIGHQPYQKFLRGRRGDRNNPTISKKLFSFRANGGRIWGYAEDQAMCDTIISKIEQKLSAGDFMVKTGKEVLNELRSLR